MKRKSLKLIAWTTIIAMLSSYGASLPVYASENEEKNNVIADVQNSEMTFQADNSLGNLLSNEIQSMYTESADNTSEQTESAFFIDSIDLEYMSAEVYYTAEYDCKLIVGLYSEDEQILYTSATVDVKKTASVAEVTFELMPDDYFLVKAYLVDSETLAPLSECCTNNFYTQETQEFYSLTPDDFRGRDVLLFYETSTENFAVFDAATTVIPYNEGVNTVTLKDDVSGNYVLENIDSSISGLTAGDIAAIYYGEQMPLIMKVDTITIDGTTASITSAEVALDEIFEFFRLNSYSSEIEYEESDLLKGVTAQTVHSAQDESADVLVKGDNDEFSSEFTIDFGEDDEGNKKASATTEFTVNLKEAKLADYKGTPDLIEIDPDYKVEASVTGSVTCSFGICLKYNFNKNGSGKTYVEFNIETAVSPSVKCKGTAKYSLPFAYKSFKVKNTGITIAINPTLEFEASVDMELSSKFTVTSGVKYDETVSDNMTAVRKNEIESIEGEKGEVGLKIEGSMYLGINLHPTIKWISDKILCLDVEQLGGGLLVKGNLYDGEMDVTREDILNDEKPAKYETSLSDEKTEQHTCMACIDGEISLHSKIKAQLKLLDIVKKDSENKGPSLSITLPDIHLLYFYIVMLDENGKEFDEANFGRCPHKVFLLNFKFKDKDTGKVINDVKYKLTDQKGNSKEFSVADYPKIWRRAGTYKISVSLDGYKDFKKDYDIEYRPENNVTLVNMGVEDYSLYINDYRTNEITIRLESIKHNITVNVVDSDGNPIDQPAIDCSYHPSGTIDNIVKSVTNTAKFLGMVKSEGKAENSFVYSLPNGEHTFKVAKLGYDTVKVPVLVDNKDMEVTIEMQKTKKNVLITVVDEEGNAIDSPVIKIEGEKGEYAPELSLPGEYSCELPVGTYKLSVSKDGYVSETGDEIAQQDITVGLLGDNVNITVTLKKQSAWQQAYADYLREQYNKKSYIKFMIAYIDDDDIPELLTAESDMRGASVNVFTYYNEQISECDDRGGESGTLYYREKKNLFMDTYGIMGVSRHWLSSIVDGKTQRVASFSTSSNNNSCFMNDEQISKDEYNKYYTEYDLDNTAKSWNVIKYTSSMVKPTEENIDKYIFTNSLTNNKIVTDSIVMDINEPILNKSTVGTYLSNTLYNLYVLRDNSAALTVNNIYYINQYRTDENGAIEISYNLEGLKEKGDYFLIPYGYTPENKNVIDKADDTDSSTEDYQYTMCIGDIIYFDTEQNDLAFTIDDSSLISLSEDGTCTAISEGTTNLKVVQNGLKTYNIKITIENAVIIGDVDEDGVVQISDATMALNIYARGAACLDTSGYTDRQKKAADVNKDGKIDISDATAILTYYAQNAAGLNPTWDKIVI